MLARGRAQTAPAPPFDGRAQTASAPPFHGRPQPVRPRFPRIFGLLRRVTHGRIHVRSIVGPTELIPAAGAGSRSTRSPRMSAHGNVGGGALRVHRSAGMTGGTTTKTIWA